MSLKRDFIDLVENAIGVRIVRPGQLPLLFEQEHLMRFFDHFSVDCVFDVGANAGQYADMIRHRVGYKGPIISFEPIPALVNAMKKRAAQQRNWFVEQVVLDQEVGVVEFNVTSHDKFSSLHTPQSLEVDLFTNEAAIVETIKVQASTIEVEFLKYQDMLGFRRPFLKMDTQGHDLAVVKGAGDTLLHFVGLQSELAIKRIYAESPTAFDALAFYRSRGFELSAFVPNNSGHFPMLVETDCILYRP